jgi:hypothetical protein
MQNRGDVLREFIRLLNMIEEREIFQQEIEVKLKDGTIIKMFVLIERPKLTLLKPP